MSDLGLVKAQQRGISRPSQIALSYDEGLGCTGAPPMIAAILQTLPIASTMVAGEPRRLIKDLQT